MRLASRLVLIVALLAAVFASSGQGEKDNVVFYNLSGDEVDNPFLIKVKEGDFGPPSLPEKVLAVYRGFLHAMRDSMDSYFRSETYKKNFHRGPFDIGFSNETQEVRDLRLGTREAVMNFFAETGIQEFMDDYPTFVRYGATLSVGFFVFSTLIITRIVAHKIVTFFEKRRLKKVIAKKKAEEANDTKEKSAEDTKEEVTEKDPVSKKED